MINHHLKGDAWMADSSKQVRKSVERAIEETRRAAKFALKAADAAEEALEALEDNDGSGSGAADQTLEEEDD